MTAKLSFMKQEMGTWHLQRSPDSQAAATITPAAAAAAGPWSNKAITEIENFFDWIVTLRVEMEVHAKKK